MTEPPPKKPKVGALNGLALCVSGNLTVTRKVFESFLVEHGATLTMGATKTTSYLVCTFSELSGQTLKVQQAAKNGVPCVSEQYVREAVANGRFPSDLSSDPIYAASRAADGGITLGSAATSVIAVQAASSVAAARNVMLAKAWDDTMDPTGWWISEKLDGIRAYWDGENFYSRQGNSFPAPAWFKEGLPKDTALDGELWCGRQKFKQALSVVKNASSGQQWEYVTYLVFDAPERRNQAYEERVAYVAQLIQHKITTPWAKAVGMQQCTGLAHLRAELESVEAKGGEGLMLRQPKSFYAHGTRSGTLLKVKSFRDEEALVRAHEPSKAHPDWCGALSLETPDGRRFSCGSGLIEKDRRNPPPIGAIVTYRYTELSEIACPRFPRYIGQRLDLNWDNYCASYVVPLPPAALVSPDLQRQNSLLCTAKVSSTDKASTASIPFPSSSLFKSLPSPSSSPSKSSSSTSSSSIPLLKSGLGTAIAHSSPNKKSPITTMKKEEESDDSEGDAATVEVSWEWRYGKEWVEYEHEDAALLESAFESGRGRHTLHTAAFTFNRHDGSKYAVRFRTMTQTNLESGTTRKIRRIETRM